MRAAEKESFRRLSEWLKPLGFEPAKTRTWTRAPGSVVHHIYLHRNGRTCGAPASASTSYRVHLNFLDPNGRVPALICRIPPKGDHFGFNGRNEGTFDRCGIDLHRYVVHIGEPWFQKPGAPQG